MKAQFFFLFALAGFALAETPFPEAKNHKVSLSEESSPYRLESSFVLAEDDTLDVGPGVKVLFGGYARLYLRGTVRIEGTAAKPVAFLNADSAESWNGLYISTGKNFFLARHLRVEKSFRNTVVRSRGLFESVRFENNYYGLWFENSPQMELSGCEFLDNRFAVSVGVGKVKFRNTRIHDNIFGIYLYSGTSFDGDAGSVVNNLEADIRKESEFAGKSRKISRDVWRRIESSF